MRIKKSRPNKIWFALFGLSLVAIGIAGIVLWPKAPKPKPEVPHPEDVVTRSVEAPAEDQIDASYSSTAKGDEPARLLISKIELTAPIQKVGIDQHGQVAVPTNINLVGWFVDGAKPGEPGLSIIDGHLDGVRGRGVFGRLAQLAPGDTITVERADKQQLAFEVFATKTTSVAEAPNWLFSQKPGIASQLNLITCAGTFDKQARNYDQRTIVSARLVEQIH